MCKNKHFNTVFMLHSVLCNGYREYRYVDNHSLLYFASSLANLPTNWFANWLLFSSSFKLSVVLADILADMQQCPESVSDGVILLIQLVSAFSAVFVLYAVCG